MRKIFGRWACAIMFAIAASALNVVAQPKQRAQAAPVFELLQGKQLPVCQAYLATLNAIDPERIGDVNLLCERPNSTTRFGIARPKSTPLSDDEVMTLWPTIERFFQGLRPPPAPMHGEPGWTPPQPLPTGSKRLAPVRPEILLLREDTSGMRSPNISPQDWRETILYSVALSRYERPVVFEDGDKLRNVLIYITGRRGCADSLISVSQPPGSMLLVMNDDWTGVDRIATTALFEYAAELINFPLGTPKSSDSKFNPIGTGMRLMEYHGKTYYDTVFTIAHQHRKAIRLPSRPSSLLVVLEATSGRPHPVCSVAWRPRAIHPGLIHLLDK